VTAGVRFAIAALALAGCAATPATYSVVAIGELGSADGAISGPLEILGANSLLYPEEEEALPRSVAAFRVTLPDDRPRRVLLYSARSCAELEDPAATPAPVDDLQLIRRVGGETHFFADVAGRDGAAVELDVQTAIARISMNPDSRRYAIGKIAVVRELEGPDGAPGRSVACGVFELVSAPGSAD
jgi:hypothetical protein